MISTIKMLPYDGHTYIWIKEWKFKKYHVNLAAIVLPKMATSRPVHQSSSQIQKSYILTYHHAKAPKLCQISDILVIFFLFSLPSSYVNFLFRASFWYIKKRNVEIELYFWKVQEISYLNLGRFFFLTISLWSMKFWIFGTVVTGSQDTGYFKTLWKFK